ncbi:hypothetical protein KEF29_03480 [Streptomyces tuirus]|uniref:Uncharacterized protein n=1 Tax=Streptomyces tuirus TaxID=68278 RepID=A0A941F7X9_9ACTN|nr:hypothetical protein [Streptomyces tuirus]
MNELIEIKTHGEPTDYRGPFDPVRAAIRTAARVVECHRCEDTTIPDLVHLADREGAPLCPDCTRLVGVALRRGLLALNQLDHALRDPGLHPAASLVWDWQAALAIARPEEEYLLRAGAQLLADHVGYRPLSIAAKGAAS